MNYNLLDLLRNLTPEDISDLEPDEPQEREGRQVTGGKNKPQKHPQEKLDLLTVSQLEEMGRDEPLFLCELARLLIKYDGWVGSFALVKRINKLMVGTGLTKAELFEITRTIHSEQRMYSVKSKFVENLDWDSERT